MSITAVKVENYGWRPDRQDPRDRLFHLEERVHRAWDLERRVSLRDAMPGIYDQSQLGSCTANADAAVLEYEQARQGEAEGSQTPSRLFIYYEERRIGGYPIDQDTGAEIRDGIKVLATEGAPPETDWPYDISRFTERPPDVAYRDAKKYEAIKYQRILPRSGGAPMRTAVAKLKCPIAFGFPVPAMFEDPSWDPASEPLPLPDATTRFIGGHAVAVVGYDFTLERFRVPVFEVRNSWGPGWGDAGHFYMDYRWFDDAQLASDLWIVQSVS